MPDFNAAAPHRGKLSASLVHDSELAVPHYKTGHLTQRELCRKLLHILPGTLPFALQFVPHPDPLDRTSLLVVATICVVLTALYVALRPIVSRPGEHDFFRTAFSYPAVVLGMLLLFPSAPELTCVVVVVIAFGDGGANLAGRLFGRRRLPWNPHKTWVGLTAFVLCAAPAASLAYWLEARPAVPFATALLCGTSATLVAACAESLDSRITDNLRVGLAAALIAAAAHFATAPFA